MSYNPNCEVCGRRPKLMVYIGTGRCSQLCSQFSDGKISREEYERLLHKPEPVAS